MRQQTFFVRIVYLASAFHMYSTHTSSIFFLYISVNFHFDPTTPHTPSNLYHKLQHSLCHFGTYNASNILLLTLQLFGNSHINIARHCKPKIHIRIRGVVEL
ncbi:hypothetical protein AAZX31_17G194000 [Glycine max]